MKREIQRDYFLAREYDRTPSTYLLRQPIFFIAEEHMIEERQGLFAADYWEWEMDGTSFSGYGNSTIEVF